MLLFIYGTLKRGFPYHHLLEGQTFRGEVVTDHSYQLLDCGEYPALIEMRSSLDAVAVSGELWEVSLECLEILNAYEGSEYELRAVRLQTTQPAFAYMFTENPGLPFAGSIWTKRGGDPERE